MAYCTKQQMIDRFGVPLLREATDRGDVATGEIDDVAIDRAIADASALIDGYVRKRVTLPLDETPPILNELCLCVAIYKLLPAVANEKIAADYKDALRTLLLISEGKVMVVSDAGSDAPSDGQVSTSGPDRRFTRDSLRGL